MIWSLCFTILFAGNYVIASVDQDDQCVYETGFSMERDDEPFRTLEDISQDVVCNYGKKRRNKEDQCRLRSMCEKEREALRARLLTCGPAFATATDSAKKDLVTYAVAKTRRFFDRTNLIAEITGLKRNSRLDRLALLVPTKYRTILESYMSRQGYSFPMPNGTLTKEMLTEVIETGCAVTLSDLQKSQLQSGFVDNLNILEATLLLLEGPLTENLRKRNSFKKMVQSDNQDLDKIQRRLQNTLKIRRNKADESLSTDCVTPGQSAQQERAITCAIMAYFERLRTSIDNGQALSEVFCTGGPSTLECPQTSEVTILNPNPSSFLNGPPV